MKETEQNEEIAGYLNPDPGRRICRRFMEEEIVPAILPRVKGPRVLEMGYGDGLWTSHIINSLGSSSVLDKSSRLLEQAILKHGDRISTHNFSFEDFIPNSLYDTVLATYVLEHVKDPVRVLKAIKSWIASDGRLIISVPNANSYHRQLAVHMGLQKRTTDLGPSDIAGGHRRVYTKQTLQRDVVEAGFQVSEQLGFIFKPLPQGMIADLPDDVLAGMISLGREIPMEHTSEIAFVCLR